MRKLWVVTCLLLLSSQLHAQEASDVRVLEVKGSAEIRLGIDKEWSVLKPGAVIPNGAWIQTALRTLVYIKFWNNTVAQIKSASLVQVKGIFSDGKSMGARIHLALGSARVRVKPDRKEKVDFKIVAPKMTTSIKGTISRTSCYPTGPVNETFSGKVSNELSNSHRESGTKMMAPAHTTVGPVSNSASKIKNGYPVRFVSVANQKSGGSNIAVFKNPLGNKSVVFKETTRIFSEKLKTEYLEFKKEFSSSKVAAAKFTESKAKEGDKPKLTSVKVEESPEISTN